MTSAPRKNRCDTVLALIDDCLAEYERSASARTNRPTHPHQEVLP